MPALLAFTHFFLIIFSYYIIKPVRDALFVKSIGPENLPYFYLAVAAITLVVVALYNTLSRHLGSRRLVLWLQLFVTANVAAFWLLMRSGTIELSAAFYIWASVYNVLLVTVFWSLTNDLFDAAQGRKLYGFIGGGGIMGGIAGSAAASVLPLRIGTIDCLAVAAGLMALAVVVTVWRLRELHPQPQSASPMSAAHDEHHGSLREDIALLFALLG